MVHKHYYTLGSTAKILGIYPSKILYFEKIFGKLSSKTNSRGYSNGTYSLLDIQRIRTIIALATRFHLGAIKKEMEILNFPFPK